MARASCGRRAREVGEKDDKKAAVEERNSSVSCAYEQKKKDYFIS